MQILLGLGDIIYPDGKSAFADAYLFKPMESILKNIPFYPALGNHDWHVNPDINFATEWKLPNNEHYYSFDYNNAHFIALDTRSGKMYDQENQIEWFENDLKNAQGKYDWIFVYFHHNGITCTYKPEYKAVVDMYPLFAKYNVDLVLNGHAHTYERLMPFDKNGKVMEHYNTPLNEYGDIKGGFIQITTGAGGKLKKDWNPGQCDKNIVAATAHRGHFTLINIKGRQLKLKAIASIGGAVLDSLVINK
ncbi:metallophosphoesterase [Thalassobellus suaedae]|uniref:Metallophosphoesterase n=1 Tax=Thalassobellus suaedae TaxID=3074124 RepID=A0ABY9XYB9_9FLAO|nr:metallophosphoesterase [Flavobacteriaceae bacterium HL-DH14]